MFHRREPPSSEIRRLDMETMRLPLAWECVRREKRAADGFDQLAGIMTGWRVGGCESFSVFSHDYSNIRKYCKTHDVDDNKRLSELLGHVYIPCRHQNS